MLCIPGTGEGCCNIQADHYDFNVQGPDKDDIGHHGQKPLGTVEDILYAEDCQCNVLEVWSPQHVICLPSV